MVNVITAVVLIFIVGAAIWYIWKEKKKGAKCIGCPYAKNGCCSCGKK